MEERGTVERVGSGRERDDRESRQWKREGR